VIARARKRTADAPVVEIGYEFGFDAAHRFASVPRGHKYRGVHGHSFRVEIALRGAPRPPHGFVADLEKVERACGAIRSRLDHKLLNNIKYLNNPSLENIALWIWNRLAPKFPGLARVTVRRDSLGQSATYFGEGKESLVVSR
jgi:6-pyruvoyltetrahydropterin/6-carboxytetrahydropterin synthase